MSHLDEGVIMSSWWGVTFKPREATKHPMVPRIGPMAQSDGARVSGKPSSMGDNTRRKRSSPVLASKADGKFEWLASLSHIPALGMLAEVLYTRPETLQGV